ncbi:unnamed protein product [Calypogeia fissa]
MDGLAAFSPAAEFLAIATPDGRVKTWDVGSGHLRGEFVDIAASTSGAGGEVNGHLAIDYSCIVWGSLPSASKKGKKKGSKDGQLVLVLGTGSGDVLAWDAVLGQLRWRTSDCNAGGVKSLAFSKDGQTLYTAGGDGMICELNSGTGEVVGRFRAAKTPVSNIAVSPDGGSLLAASSELKLFDLASKKRISKFPGHAAVVNALAFSQDGKYVVSSATGERQVAVWQVQGSKSERGAVCSLSLDHPAVALSGSAFNAELGEFNVVAVSTTGVAYVWHASALEQLESFKPIKVSVGNKSAKVSKALKQIVLAASLEAVSGESPKTLLVAHGTSAKPIFEHVSLGAPGTQVVLEVQSGGTLLPATQRAETISSEKAEAVTVLGPDNAADAVISRPLVESGDIVSTAKKTKKKRQASVDLDAEPQSAEAQQPKAADGNAEAMDEDDEQTMEEKLIAFGIVDKVQSNSENPGTTVVPPRADSVQVLLSQALQADDAALLEQCLAVSDEKVIGNTVRTLRPTEAAKFLSVCIVKLETRPRRGLALVPWVRTVLLQHAATLMSNPAMQPVLATLYQLIEARLSVFRPLLALSGRLDLIMAQISANEAEVAEDSDAVVVYEEQDSEVEVEDVEDDGILSEDCSDTDADSEDDTMESAEEIEVKPQGNGNGHLSADGIDDDSD